MGTENELDVEGQTEPPICGFKSSVATPSSTLIGTSGTDDADATDADAGATFGRGSITSTLDTAQVLSPEAAHTLSVPDICALLDTHAEYVFFLCLETLANTG